MLYSIVGILVIIIDQLVKFWVEDTLFGTDIVRFIPGVISLVNVHNYGAAFGFLDTSGARIYFLVAAGLFALLVVIALATNFITGRLSRWCLVFVAAGGLGNMIDRLLYGYVVDMFKVELFNFPVFNVADIFITVFSILFVLAMFFEKPDDDIETLYEDIEEAEEKPKKARSSRSRSRKAKAEAPVEAPAQEEVVVVDGAPDPTAILISEGIEEDVARQITAIFSESGSLREAYNKLRSVFGNTAGRDYYNQVKDIASRQ